MSFRVSDGLFAAVVRPLHGEHGGEPPDLFGVPGKPAGQGVAEVVAVWPVPQAVVDAAGLHGFVVAGARVGEQLRVLLRRRRRRQ
jgi:hypothetical protein